MSIPFSSIEDAFLWASMDQPGMHHAWINRNTGQAYCTTEMGDNFDEEPEDFAEGHWIPLPHKHDLDLGRDLAFRFVENLTDKQEQDVKSFFRSKGAYRRFRHYLQQNGILDSWYAFEQNATNTALRVWAEENGIPISPN